MPIRVSKDRIDMDNRVLQRPILKDYSQTVITANSGISYTADLNEGNMFNITLTGDCTFTFANPPATGTACSFTLILTQDATGSRTVTWPGAVTWLGNTTPTLATTTDAADVLKFTTIDGGTTWFGSLTMGNIDTS